MIRLRETKMWRKIKKTLYEYISFIVFMETEDIYVDITKDVETRFDPQIMSWTDHYLSKKAKTLWD